jgi:gamma-glutamyltranspeptidase/glutathione hydrolase
MTRHTRRTIRSLVLCLTLIGIAVPPIHSQNAVGDRRNPRGGGTRSAVRAMNGMIATSHPLASAAGLRVLQNGGNAIDAAIAAAAVLCVVEPMMVSPGGDLFALIWDAKRREIKALNASGRAPRALSIDELSRRGLTRMPGDGIHTVTVPGAVDGWATLSSRYGTKKLSELLQPAIEYAERGFPVTEVIGRDWADESSQHAKNADFASTYLPQGRPPAIGEIFVLSRGTGAENRRFCAQTGRSALPRRLRRADLELDRSDQHHLSRLHRL